MFCTKGLRFMRISRILHSQFQQLVGNARTRRIRVRLPLALPIPHRHIGIPFDRPPVSRANLLVPRVLVGYKIFVRYYTGTLARRDSKKDNAYAKRRAEDVISHSGAAVYWGFAPRNLHTHPLPY